MPMPTPRPDEDREDFMDRCMGDDVMVEDFTNPRQRAGACATQWDDRKKAAPPMEHKTFAISNWSFKADDDGPGSFEGLGAAFGNVDQGGDVILPGAFADALPEFIERGFVPIGHNWMGLPVATIGKAKETDDGLWFSADFHSTQSAQDARTVVRERFERGKFVGLSIGFLPDFDDGIEFREDGVRVIKRVKQLAEVSIVTVPMNTLAGITDAKAGPGAVPFTERAERVLSDVQDFALHAERHAAMRGEFKVGRVLSAANRSRLSEIAEALRTGASGLDTILSETDPEKDQKAVDMERVRLRWLLDDVDMLLAEAR